MLKAEVLTIVVLVHLVFPLLFLVLLWLARVRSRGEWVLRWAMVGALVLYLFLAGQWSWLSYYLRFVFVAAWLVGGWWSSRRVRGLPWVVRPGRRRLAFIALELVALGMFGGFFLVNALRGLSYSGAPAELTFPLREGVYYVANGGSTPFLNIHVRVPAQAYGVDIVELNGFGARARGLYPTDLTRYVIYGRAIHAPCTGVVASARDGLPDLIPPASDRANLAGNFVALSCGRTTVLLAHMQTGSVMVRPGDRVVVGQSLGRVGNSGNTSEPHLHIHAVEGHAGDPVRSGLAVPMTFGGRFLVRNSLVW